MEKLGFDSLLFLQRLLYLARNCAESKPRFWAATE